MKCANCLKVMPEGFPASAEFCPFCGTKFVAVCPSCGEKIIEGAQFCYKCGERVGSGPASGDIENKSGGFGGFFDGNDWTFPDFSFDNDSSVPTAVSEIENLKEILDRWREVIESALCVGSYSRYFFSFDYEFDFVNPDPLCSPDSSDALNYAVYIIECIKENYKRFEEDEDWKNLEKKADEMYRIAYEEDSRKIQEEVEQSKREEEEKHKRDEEAKFNNLCVDVYNKLFEERFGKIERSGGEKLYITHANQKIDNVVESWGPFGGTSTYSRKSEQELMNGCNGHFTTGSFGEVNCVAVSPAALKVFYAKGNEIFSVGSNVPIISTKGNVCSMFYCGGILAVTSLNGLQYEGYHQDEWQMGDFGSYYYRYYAKLVTAFYRVNDSGAQLLQSFNDMSAIRSGYFIIPFGNDSLYTKNNPNLLQIMDYDFNLYYFDCSNNLLNKFRSGEEFEKTFPFAKFGVDFNRDKDRIVGYIFDSINGNYLLNVLDNGEEKILKSV